MGEVEEISRKYGIGYWRNGIKFLEILFSQNRLTLRIRIQGYKINDPKRLTKELNIKDDYWKKIYKDIFLKSLDQITDIMNLIKQAYEKAE